MTAFLAILLPVIIMAAAGVLGTILQIGWLVTAEKMKPDIAKLNPLPAFMRLFSMQNGLELIKGFIKMTVVAVVCYIILKPMMISVEHYAGMPMEHSAERNSVSGGEAFPLGHHHHVLAGRRRSTSTSATSTPRR